MIFSYTGPPSLCRVPRLLAKLVVLSALTLQLSAADRGPRKPTFTEILKLIGSDAPEKVASGHYALNGYYHEKGLKNIPDWERKIVKKLILAGLYESDDIARRAAITNLTCFTAFLEDDDYRGRCAKVIADFNQRQEAAYANKSSSVCDRFTIRKTKDGSYKLDHMRKASVH